MIQDLSYAIGGLMYMPALRTDIAEIIVTRKYEDLMSVAICLEDSIQDFALGQAEQQLCETVKQLKLVQEDTNNLFSHRELPLIFVRIRNAEHLKRVHNMLMEVDQNYDRIVRGFLLPKFDTTNMMDYLTVMDSINRECKVFALPIFETEQLIDVFTSSTCLRQIKTELDKREYVLGIRTGGNDFCNIYGLRRGVHQTIYDIEIVGRALCNIANIFGRDYVVSAPVWEYFSNGGDNSWRKGLEKEIERDKINGFIGKTVIHPSQLRSVRNSLMVSRADYADAIRILDEADPTAGFGVHKSSNGHRMNETKTHKNWALKIKTMAKIWGLKD